MKNETDAFEITDDDLPVGDDEDTNEESPANTQAWDISLREELISQHMHLVQSVARRFSGLGESLDDLVQEGTIGLLKAVDQFDPDRGVKFSTYACHLITSQIQHYLRDRGRIIRQPAWVQELNAKVTKMSEQLFQELGREPLLSEISERLSLPETTVSHALASRELNLVVSLSAPTDGANEGELTLMDKDKSLSEKLTSMNLPIEDRLVLEDAISSLKTLEQNVVRLFFFEGLNQSEIARKLNISANYASYLLRRSTSKIKTILEKQHEEESIALQNDSADETPRPTADLPTYDSNTGLYTSVYLKARVAEEIERGRRYPTNFALMVTSLANLPVDAEQKKHAISKFAGFLRKGTRAVDMIAYHENGRFLLLLPHTGREAKILGDRLRAQVSNLMLPSNESEKVYLHFGFAVYPMDGTTVDSMYKRADLALASSLKDETPNP